MGGKEKKKKKSNRHFLQMQTGKCFVCVCFKIKLTLAACMQSLYLMEKTNHITVK